jgi:hypothetical protein
MKNSKLSYKIASWVLMIGGVIHTTFSLLTPKTPEQAEITLTMKNFTAQVLGSEINIYDFHQGFSLMMGLLLFGYGAINLLILKNNQLAPLPSNIILLNVIITFIGTLLSIRFFFIIPILLTGIPFLGYLVSFLIKNNK